MGERQARQAELLRLAESMELGSQSEMVRVLRKKGIQATQASISRDLRELGLVRINGRYVSASRIAVNRKHGSEPFENELIISVDPVGANLIVIKTPPGAAANVAVKLDSQGNPDIAGTVAGDDTIFAAVCSRAAQGRALVMLRRAATGAQRPGDHQ